MESWMFLGEKNEKEYLVNKPRKGQDIYVPDFYDFGTKNDFRGGLATICEVSHKAMNGAKKIFIKIAERPSFEYIYDDLISKQETLIRRYGKFRARSLFTRYERERTI